MNEQQRWPRMALVTLVAGVLWLWSSAGAGLGPFLFFLPISAALLATGFAQLLWPGDLRITQTMALAGALGLFAFLPCAWLIGFAPALVMAIGAGASLLAAGSMAVYQEPLLDGVPVPEPGFGLSAKVALDEVVLGLEQFSVGLPTGSDARRLVGEIMEARELFEERGYFDDPRAYHRAPPPLEQPTLRAAHSGRIAYEHLSFESGYEPHPDEPGAQRWLSYGPTRTAHAYVLRHHADDRPWMICNNGYRTGIAPVDLRAFWRFYADLGLNVLIPVLPLHGPRRVGRISGDGFFSGEVLDSVHAEAQAMWDIRRLIGWARAEGATAVGTTGLSLGGYTTALLAAVEEGLACAIAGIPVADLARIFWRHGPELQLNYLQHVRLDQALVTEVLRVVSPLAIEPLVPKPARMIYGGISDRLVPPDHIRDLAEHWDNPRTVWYQGAHLTFRLDPHVDQGIDLTLRDAKLIP
jgi:dienelactone hydrolase